ncbi:glycoside hydrolase family 16 protein [Nocardioides bigeumensis]|uniref:GH16 domain-containing protein n=1 Tax=Nocardioides bigeumensis TaxID=433657 RepID=A0ABP5KRV9_9ACTN
MPSNPNRRYRAAAALSAVSLTVTGALAGAMTTSAEAGVDAAASTSSSTSAAAAKQKTSLTVLPPISQFGKKPAAAKKAKTVVTATFTPAKKGRPVSLYVKSGGWKKVATTKTTQFGIADFTIPTKKGATYKATAASYRGLPAITAKPAKNTWKSADFTDEFGGSALSAEWAQRQPFYNPAGLRNCAKGDPSASVVSGGTLRLSVLLDPARTAEKCAAKKADGSTLGSFAYRLNGHISTDGNHDFKFGVAAARIKFQKEKGGHTSFWLQPTSYNPDATSAKTDGAEVDIIEWFGQGGRQSGLTSFIYEPTPKGPKKTGGFLKQQDRFLANKKDAWYKNYHVFSVEWTPKHYVFRIDSKVSAVITNGISHVPQYPILSLLSSDYELANAPGDAKSLPQHSYVDWMQIWEY